MERSEHSFSDFALSLLRAFLEFLEFFLLFETAFFSANDARVLLFLVQAALQFRD